MKYKSVLETEYVKPTRPYSTDELQSLRLSLYKYLKLSNLKVSHTKCGHHYFVKENSRKEKEIKEKEECIDVGNCSCCWKLSKTPNHLKNSASGLIDAYTKTFEKEPEKMKYEYLDVETCYYKWLYQDNFDDEKKHKKN